MNRICHRLCKEIGMLGVELQCGCLEWTDSFLIVHIQGILEAL